MPKKYPFAGRHIYLCIFFSAFLSIAISVPLASAGETGQTPSTSNTSEYKTRHVFIVVMDGVRYSETFGDSATLACSRARSGPKSPATAP